MSLAIRPQVRRLFAAATIACTESSELLASKRTENQITSDTHYSPTQVEIFQCNSQLKSYVIGGCLSDARQLFDKMPQKDEVSWTTMISGYVNALDSSEALLLFSDMWLDPSVRIDPFSLSLAFKACGLSMETKNGELLHGYAVKSGLVNSVFVGSALLDMYMKTGKLMLGCKVFDEMFIRNVVSWTAIITGLVRAGYNMEALAHFSQMWRSRVNCDSYTFAIALKACADLGAMKYGKEIHTQTLKRGFSSNSYVANTLATMYNKCGKLDYGMRLFERMTIQDVVSWTTIITTFVQRGQEELAVQAFLHMLESGVSPNEYTFAAVISGCAGLARIQSGEQLHASVLQVGLMDSLSVANSIMTMYSKCGRLDSAAAVFDAMAIRDIISWSTIIAGYCQGGDGGKAFELLSLMRKEGPKPNEYALASVLSVCGNLALLEWGRQIHGHVLSLGLENMDIIQSSLINMYSKCGSIKEAEHLFNSDGDDNIVTWTAMINGYAEHGLSQESINLFEMIPKVGLRPDSVAYIGVLSACSHAGLVDLGFHYFNSMSKDYYISPSKEHYGCVVDLLCRVGRLHDAEVMINTMPFDRDDVVWSSLLRACSARGDVERGKRAAEKILEVDPNCAGTRITLANIYATRGRWQEAADIRKFMKSEGIIKEPGWSWIKVKDHLSAFVAGDRSHPQGEDIYFILDSLNARTDIADNSLEMVSLLFDVTA
ncbi:E motif [Dillenia turbinata]|uniref:E motif n=1 Tax=Dillenia turbinata TaxID=194707 RepID=A0AAN8Z6U1_9MAGN